MTDTTKPGDPADKAADGAAREGKESAAARAELKDRLGARIGAGKEVRFVGLHVRAAAPAA
jgi:hypothetical protein